MYKMVDGVKVKMTDEEVAARKAEEAAYMAELPMNIWRSKITALDNGMPRYVEDIIDALPESTRSKIASQTLDKYNAKKTLRAQRPA